MKEIWRDIKKYNGMYQVSNLGNVRSVDRIVKYINRYGTPSEQLHKGKIIAQTDNGKGYKVVHLYMKNKMTNEYVHRLVAETFIGEIPEGYAVNHIDFNKGNNMLNNLEIVTYSENNKHSAAAGRYKNTGGKAVKVYYKDGSIAEYGSITEASKGIGVHRDTLVKHINHGSPYGNKKFSELNIDKIEQFK